jgi:hypothetical protein
MSAGVVDRQGRPGWVKDPTYKTASQMRKARRQGNMPNLSCDIDGDGVVSAEDLKIAARYDVDADGVLQPGEVHKLRIGLVSDTLSVIRRMQKAGQLSRNKPAIVEAVQAFADVEKAVDMPDFNKQFKQLRSCVAIGNTKDSVQVRELINPSNTMRGVPDSKRASARVPTYLLNSMASTEHAIVAISPEGDDPTPRWLKQRAEHTAMMTEVARADAKLFDSLETVRPREQASSGLLTKSQLEAARRSADIEQGVYMNDYTNFGGDYHYPNSLKAKTKRRSRAQRTQGDLSECSRSSHRDSSAASSQGSSGQAMYEDERWGAKPVDRVPSAQRDRVTGYGTHISIYPQRDKAASPVFVGDDTTSARRRSRQPAAQLQHSQSKAGRDGPLHRGGRLPSPLFDDISVSTFAKPLSETRAAV